MIYYPQYLNFMSECTSYYLEKMLFRDEDKKCVAAKVLAEIDKWLERFDCLVVGPGLGRDPFLLVCIGWSLFSLHALAWTIVHCIFSNLGVSMTRVASSSSISMKISRTWLSKRIYRVAEVPIQKSPDINFMFRTVWVKSLSMQGS